MSRSLSMQTINSARRAQIQTMNCELAAPVHQKQVDDRYHGVSRERLRHKFIQCDGNDPFHNFNIAVKSDNGMSMQLPFPTPGKLRLQNENCLGRKRPLECDDSDPFLTPEPSVLPSRKIHGKILPIVRRSRDCVGPLVYKEEE